jgi:hypothetical protein
MSELDPRLRDEIDDQVAEALDAYLTEPGPLRDALRGRRTWPLWLAIVLTNVAWLVVVKG